MLCIGGCTHYNSVKVRGQLLWSRSLLQPPIRVPGFELRLFGFHSKHLYLPSHPASPENRFYNNTVLGTYKRKYLEDRRAGPGSKSTCRGDLWPRSESWNPHGGKKREWIPPNCPPRTCHSMVVLTGRHRNVNMCLKGQPNRHSLSCVWKLETGLRGWLGVTALASVCHTARIAKRKEEK